MNRYKLTEGIDLQVQQDNVPVAYLARIIEDLSVLIKGVKPENIIFHTIELSNENEGAIAVAYGKENDSTVYADYIENAEWITYG